jgi:menaquinone-dependent protoporphyrinogen IX oxidase
MAWARTADQQYSVKNQRMLLFYATRDGQSRRIATAIASALAKRGFAVTPRSAMAVI